MLPDFLLPDFMRETPERRREREEIEKRARALRMKRTKPWDPEMKWEPELNIQAKTYKVLSLFDVKPTPHSNVNGCEDGELVVSPGGQFCYCEKVLKRGTALRTMNGSKRGSVIFDGKVIIPALHERVKFHNGDTPMWNPSPWMSLTPMETMTLRAGTKRAKGDVIVAGLGLGHQLIEVSKRKKVTRLRLVEKSQELVDWLLPRIEPHLEQKLDDVIVGDAYEELPKLKADVALVDIFDSYGHNDWERDKIRCRSENIEFVWAWGTARLGGSLW